MLEIHMGHQLGSLSHSCWEHVAVQEKEVIILIFIIPEKSKI